MAIIININTNFLLRNTDYLNTSQNSTYLAAKHLQTYGLRDLVTTATANGRCRRKVTFPWLWVISSKQLLWAYGCTMISNI